MAGTRRLLAMMMASFVAGGSGSGKLEALGIVAQADRARLGSGEAAAEGTTIYDGDRLTTDAGGSLQLFIGQAALHLAEQSSAIVHRSASEAASEFEAELISGAVVVSVTPKSAGEIVAGSARIRPAPEKRGVVQVRLVGPRELIVFARRGPAEIFYRDESETIPEGKSYRVLLNASGDGGADTAAAGHARKRNKALLLVAGSGVAAGVGIALAEENRGKHKGMESPDRP